MEVSCQYRCIFLAGFSDGIGFVDSAKEGRRGRGLLFCAFWVTQRLTAASMSASDVTLKGYSSQELRSPLPLHLFLGV